MSSAPWEPFPDHNPTKRLHRAIVLGFQVDMTFNARCRQLGVDKELALRAPAQAIGEHELARRYREGWRE